jgi:methylenetetrahydrofolate reductase (NADPH)
MMKLTELMRGETPSLSFEVFPPKTDDAFDTVHPAVCEIAKLKPAFMSVTYGAGGGTSKYTLDIAAEILRDYGVPSIAHLTCVSSSRETVHRQITAIHEAGVRNVMALRGDIPAERAHEDRSAWDYRYAVDLIRELKESPYDFCIGGACYPEVHPESVNQKEDIRRLKEKVDAGCDFLTTQMFFDNLTMYNFLYKVREAGIQVPILAGIMPITNEKQVGRSVALSGATIPQKFKRMIDSFGDDPARMQQAGIIYASEQIIDLISNGVSHIHVYTMNKPDVAAGILHCLSEFLK